MSDRITRIYFDFVDPLSYVASRALQRADPPLPETFEWVGFELRPPPAPLTSLDNPFWAARLASALPSASALGIPLDPPDLVPWTRKAHELHRHAAAHGMGEEVRQGILEAYFGHRRDIGRVDVLVDVAVTVGLDRTETKAVLDVDRYEPEVLSARKKAEARGVSDVPSYSSADRAPEGFPDPLDLGTLLPDP